MKTLLFFLCFIISSFAYSQESENIIELYTTLTPNAGSFVATSNKARGRLLKTGELFSADRISVFSDSFLTENTLRDKHLADYLAGGDSRPHPRIDLTNLKGQNNLATATLIINGISKELNINYSVKKDFIETAFEIDTTDFKLKPASFLGVQVSPKVKVVVKYFWESK